MLLGPRSSLTPRDFGSTASYLYRVSFSSIPVIIHSRAYSFLAHSSPPLWKQLVNSTLAAHNRIPLIVTIFSDRDEVEIVGHLRGDDAQTFIDVIDEVSIHTLSPLKNRSSFPHLHFCALSVRH